MFRLFFFGTAFGLFLNSKKGRELLQTADEMLSELASGNDAIKAIDQKRNELTEQSSKSFGKVSESIEDKLKQFDFIGRKAETNSSQSKDEKNEFADKDEFEGDEDFNPDSSKKDAEEIVVEDRPLDADKAQELADKLGAKPSAPADENLAAFHPDEERKSA